MWFTRVVHCAVLLGALVQFMAEGAPPLKRSPNSESGPIEGQFPGAFPDDDDLTDYEYFHQFDPPEGTESDSEEVLVEIPPSNLFTNNGTFVPECARKTQSYFCEEIDEYPLEYFKAALVGTKFERLLKRNWNIRPDLVPRDGGFPQLCTSEQTVIFPRSGYNGNGELRFLFNEERNQAVEVEVCQNVVHHCENLDANKLGFASTHCSQQYRLVEMVALSPEGQPYEEDFKFPSGCVCSFSPQTVKFDPHRNFESKSAIAASRKIRS